jgi:hypothetical protein
VGGEDANKFTLNGSELTFKAPEFQDGSDNTYRVNIKATWSHWARGLRTAEKTLTVTGNSGALKVNSLPFKVNLLASSPPTIAKPFSLKISTFLITVSLITLFAFSNSD